MKKIMIINNSGNEMSQLIDIFYADIMLYINTGIMSEDIIDLVTIEHIKDNRYELKWL